MVKVIFTVIFFWIFSIIRTILERVLEDRIKTNELIANQHDTEYGFFVTLTIIIVSVISAVKLEKYLLNRELRRNESIRLIPNILFFPIAFILFLFCFLTLIYIEQKFIMPLLPFPEGMGCYHVTKPPLWIELFFLDGTGHIDGLVNLNHLFLLCIFSGFLSLAITNKLDKLLLSIRKKVKSKII